MILKRLLVNNAGPFLSEWEVEFPLGVTAIVAEYAGSPSSSNRGGKSFFAVDAPMYAQFGKFRGKTDDFVHRLARGKEDGFVEMEAENSEGTNFVIRRGRTKGGDPIRTLDGSSIKEADLERVVVEEILGLNLEEYKLTTAFVQGEMHAFMKMTPAEKRRVISPWFRTDRWIPRADFAKKRLAGARQTLRDLDVLEKHASNVLERGEEIRKTFYEVVEPTYKEAKLLLEAAMERRAVALAAVKEDAGKRIERDELRKEVARLEEEVAEERREAEVELEQAELDLVARGESLEGASGRADEILRLEREVETIDELRAAVADVQAEIRTGSANGVEAARERKKLLAKYKEVEASRTGTCPVLREACDRIELDPEVLATIKREGLSKRREIDRISKKLEGLKWTLEMSKSDLETVSEGVRRLERLRGKPTVAQAQDAHELAKRRAEDAEAALGRIKLARSESTRALSRSRRRFKGLEEGVGDDSTRELAAAAEALVEAESVLGDAEQERAEYLAELAEVERAKDELEGLEKRRKEARDALETISWTAYAFGATGIPSRELENAFGVAEDAMNRILSDLGSPTQLRFSPARDLKDWEPGCLACGFVYPKGERSHVCPDCGVPRRKRRRDELRLEVLDGEYESSFELDSGGGQVLLSLGSRLGLATLPAATRRVRCEHAIIDEPDGALDAPNRTALHRLLSNRLPDLGIRQALLITHADVREEFESVVVVRRWADEDRSGVWID